MMQSEVMKALAEALEMNMKWIGPPPTDAYSYDSLREDAWAKGELALSLFRAQLPNYYVQESK